MFISCLLLAGALFASNLGPTGGNESYQVEQSLDICYHDAHDRQVLDVLRPKGLEDRPVVIFVHGGAWFIGDKYLLGLYRGFGRFLAKQGIVAVMVNYRLSPAVKHPEHVKDVARAFAWTRRHIKEYGGDPDRIFLCGHSAGGHLVSLLATNPTFLNDEHLKLGDDDRNAIRGVISICGVYLIPTGDEFASLVAEMMGGLVSKEKEVRSWGLRFVIGSLVRGAKNFNPFPLVFGDDAKVCAEASPLKNIHQGLPPFLLINAERDLPTLPEMAKEFTEKLQENGNSVMAMTVKHRYHITILFRTRSVEDQPGKAIVEFIGKNAK